MGIMIFMLKSQRLAFRWPNNFRARLYMYIVQCTLYYVYCIMYMYFVHCMISSITILRQLNIVRQRTILRQRNIAQQRTILRQRNIAQQRTIL